MRFSLHLSFLLLLQIYPVSLQENYEACDKYYFNFYEWKYSELFSKLEKALINNKTVMTLLRQYFMITDSISIYFKVQLEVVKGTNLSSSCENMDEYLYFDTFCPSNSTDHWELCNLPDEYTNGLLLMFSSITLDEIESEAVVDKIDVVITWLSLLHGNLLSSVTLFNLWPYYYSYYYDPYDSEIDYTSVSMSLVMDTLDCNPSIPMTQCALSELLSWIKVYSDLEFGGKPQMWDQSQKGTVTLPSNGDDENQKDVLKLMEYQMNLHTFIKLSSAEYVFVSTSLALVIAKFFPGVHNQIVSRVTRLEHQSLYWGTAVVSNVFVYGLLFAGARGCSINLQSNLLNIFWPNYLLNWLKFVLPPSVQEVVINVILFVGAVIASLKNTTEIPIPKGMAKVLINISFFWSCFCCCCCCSRRCKVKALRVLIMFSFMVFIYCNIMDAISFVFMIFIEQSRVMMITMALLYISLIVFLVLSVSFSLFILFYGSNAGMSIAKQTVYFIGGVCTLISVFGAVGLLVVVYLIIFFSLKLQGFSGILTGLIPTIALSAASWYIKKRLLKRAISQPRNQSDNGVQPECGTADADGDIEEHIEEDDQKMLLHV